MAFKNNNNQRKHQSPIPLSLHILRHHLVLRPETHRIFYGETCDVTDKIGFVLARVEKYKPDDNEHILYINDCTQQTSLHIPRNALNSSSIPTTGAILEYYFKIAINQTTNQIDIIYCGIELINNDPLSVPADSSLEWQNIVKDHLNVCNEYYMTNALSTITRNNYQPQDSPYYPIPLNDNQLWHEISIDQITHTAVLYNQYPIEGRLVVVTNYISNLQDCERNPKCSKFCKVVSERHSADGMKIYFHRPLREAPKLDYTIRRIYIVQTKKKYKPNATNAATNGTLMADQPDLTLNSGVNIQPQFSYELSRPSIACFTINTTKNELTLSQHFTDVMQFKQQITTNIHTRLFELQQRNIALHHSIKSSDSEVIRNRLNTLQQSLTSRVFFQQLISPIGDELLRLDDTNDITSDNTELDPKVIALRSQMRQQLEHFYDLYNITTAQNTPQAFILDDIHTQLQHHIELLQHSMTYLYQSEEMHMFDRDPCYAIRDQDGHFHPLHMKSPITQDLFSRLMHDITPYDPQRYIGLTDIDNNNNKKTIQSNNNKQNDKKHSFFTNNQVSTTSRTGGSAAIQQPRNFGQIVDPTNVQQQQQQPSSQTNVIDHTTLIKQHNAKVTAMSAQIQHLQSLVDSNNEVVDAIHDYYKKEEQGDVRKLRTEYDKLLSKYLTLQQTSSQERLEWGQKIIEIQQLHDEQLTKSQNNLNDAQQQISQLTQQLIKSQQVMLTDRERQLAQRDAHLDYMLSMSTTATNGSGKKRKTPPFGDDDDFEQNDSNTNSNNNGQTNQQAQIGSTLKKQRTNDYDT